MNYQTVAKKAYNAIKKYGSACFIVRKGEEVYNPATNSYEAVETHVNGYALQENYKANEIDGTRIQVGDVKLMAVFESTPVNGDEVVFGVNRYVVVDFDKLSPDGETNIYYGVQCR